MKMKLLDYTIMSLMAGSAAGLWAAEINPRAAVASTAPASAPETEAAGVNADCAEVQNVSGGQCDADGHMLFRLQSQSYDQPVTLGTSRQSSSQELAPDRRVTLGLKTPGRADARGRFSFSLPDGGVIWATEDPTLGQAELTASGPTLVPFDMGSITKSVNFYVRSNYPAFIDRMELLVFRSSDTDFVKPIATVPLKVGAVVSTEWDGQLSSDYRYRVGDELIYIVRAYGKPGTDGKAVQFDETYPSKFQLVTPQDEQRANTLLRDNLEKSMNGSLSLQQALQQSLINSAFAGNGLRLQNIPFYGSRIRVQGRNIPEGTTLKINDQSYPVDLEGKFVAEYMMPVGQHEFDVAVDGRGGKVERKLGVDVSGEYFFGVALADVTLQGNRISGSHEGFKEEGRDKDLLTDARLAFYLKSKLKSKYLITAQADTTERPIGSLFNGFTDTYARDVFRRLDPDQYYLTYGDDSTTTRDVDTQGRMYLRADWDKNQALWGNYATGLTGTEFAQYQRSLYGAAASLRSNETTQLGEAKSQLRVFASDSNTAHGHTELLGTGGSLYYLRHTDILPGSDIVMLEVRDRATGRTISTQQLVRGADYEVDSYQGRIITRRPLAQIASESNNTITRDAPLSGYEQRLLVDYEYAPSDLRKNMTLGGRGKQWIGEHVAVGGTYVDEQNEGDDYKLKSVDVTLQAGRGTYLKVERSHSESTSVPVFFSDNGGLSFTRLNPAAARKGDATSVEARVNLQEQGITQSAWSTGAWWRKVDAGFSTARTDYLGQDVTEYGAELLGELRPDMTLYAKHSRAERGGESLTQSQVTTEWRMDDRRALTAEVRRIDEDRYSGQGIGTLAALKYSQRLNPSLELYGIGQATLDNDGGKYRNNDAVTAGARYLFGNQSSVSGEATHGSRGNALTMSGEYRLTPEHSFYGAYTVSTDTTQYDSLFNNGKRPGLTLGQRWRLSQRTNIFNESQYLKDPRSGSGLAHTFGMDFYPGQNWRLGYTLQHGDLTASTGNVSRDAISLYGGRTNVRTNWSSKVEWRRDSGSENRTQWVLTNYLTHKVDNSWRIAGKLNYSETKDRNNAEAGAKLVESSIGFAYRPWDSSRWGLFGRYTYLYDMSSLGQVGWDGTASTSSAYYDQQSHVVSLEGVYRWTQKWESVVKFAHREGKARFGRGTGQWFDSATTFAAVQARYEVMNQWHALVEYRWLGVKDGGDKNGWLVGVDRDLTKNLRVGVGYNFTDFKGDLTKVDDYRAKGWYINMVGYY